MNTNNKKTIITILIIIILGSWFLDFYYQFFSYETKIIDYIITDIIKSLFSILGFSIISWLGAFKITSNKIIDVFIFTIGYIILEIIATIYLSSKVMESKTIFALLISCLLTLSVLYFLNKKEFKKYSSQIKNKVTL